MTGHDDLSAELVLALVLLMVRARSVSVERKRVYERAKRAGIAYPDLVERAERLRPAVKAVSPSAARDVGKHEEIARKIMDG